MKKRKRLSAAMLSAAGTLLGGGCVFMLGGKNALWLAACLLTAAPAFCLWQQEERRLKICFGLLGAAFVMATALGVRLDTAQQTGWDGLLLCLGAGLGLGAGAGQLAIWLYRVLQSAKKQVALTPCRAFWLSFAACVVCWLPVLLAYFPGVTGYDMDGQIGQITSGNYNTHHPLLHTLFVQAFIVLGEWLTGSMSVGYGIHTVAQSILLAGSIAYAMRWLCVIGCGRVLWWLLLAFFALSPQHALLAVAGTKDILFAAGLLVVCVEMIRFLMEKERAFSWRVWTADIILIMLMGLLRNNAIYALLAVFMVCVACFRRQVGVRLLAVMLAGIVLTFGGETVLQKATDAADGSIREMLCIPCQQLGRVYHLYGLDVPVGYEIRETLPFAEDYAPERADFTKRQARVTTSERLIGFLKLWAREAIRYPIEYIDAFLYTSKGYWDIQDLSYSTIYDRVEPGVPRGAIVMLHNDSLGIDELGCWPQVKELCRRLVTLNEYQQNPVLWLLLHPALYSWLLLFALTCAWYRRDRALLVSGGLALAYLLTLLLGPCVLIRYQYNLMLIAPVLIGLLCSAEKEKQDA